MEVSQVRISDFFNLNQPELTKVQQANCLTCVRGKKKKPRLLFGESFALNMAVGTYIYCQNVKCMNISLRRAGEFSVFYLFGAQI